MEENDYSEILNRYPVIDHSRYLLCAFHEWVKAKGVAPGHFSAHPELLKQVSLNFFTDIKRLEDFHKPQMVNAKKTAAFEAAWILRIKPIQLSGFDNTRRKYYVLANELFALQAVLARMYDTTQEQFLNADELCRWKAFFGKLMYHFHHRLIDPQAFELMFEALDIQPRYIPH